MKEAISVILSFLLGNKIWCFICSDKERRLKTLLFCAWLYFMLCGYTINIPKNSLCHTPINLRSVLKLKLYFTSIKTFFSSLDHIS